MLHVRRVVERNKSQGKSLDAESGWMNDHLRGCLVILVREEDC